VSQQFELVVLALKAILTIMHQQIKEHVTIMQSHLIIRFIYRIKHEIINGELVIRRTEQLRHYIISILTSTLNWFLVRV
jgi:hypothetical protein